MNDELVKVKKSQFTVSDVKEDQNITVYFASKTIFDYMILWIILDLLIVVVIVMFVLYKKKKIKLPSFVTKRFTKNKKGEGK